MSVYLSRLKSGTRVAIAPHTDLWMMGERYGTVTAVGRKWVHIRGDRSERLFKLAIHRYEKVAPSTVPDLAAVL